MSEEKRTSAGEQEFFMDDGDVELVSDRKSPSISEPLVLQTWFNIVMIFVNVTAVISVTILAPFAFGLVITGDFGTTWRDVATTWLFGGYLWINTLVLIFGVYFIWSETVKDAINRIRIIRRK